MVNISKDGLATSQTCCRRKPSWAPPPTPRQETCSLPLWQSYWPAVLRYRILRIHYWFHPISNRFKKFSVFPKRAVCVYGFTKMNSFCQCAPSLRLLEWMGSCIQGPSSCNEQDGVQSLFHHRFFPDWERQLPSIGWVQPWQTRFLWFPNRKNVPNVSVLKNVWKVLWILLRWIQYEHLRYRTTWWGRGVVHLDSEPEYQRTWQLWYIFGWFMRNTHLIYIFWY